MQQKEIIKKCQKLLLAYKNGQLGQTTMPEDSSPNFKKNQKEERLAYFSLPMALNYQRNSYMLWDSALKTFQDPSTKDVFEIKKVVKMPAGLIRIKLLKYKLALQPNKHIDTWQKISKTVSKEFGSFENLLQSADYDYLKLKEIVQIRFKKGFPYLSGAKIFNYWCFILNSYCNCDLKNSAYIEIAPDTHITKCSVILGVITPEEASTFTKTQINERWRKTLEGSGINPIEMHPPLWFWSRNGFLIDI